MQSLTRRLSQQYSRASLAASNSTVLLIAYAVILGTAIAQEKWIFVVALSVLPFVILWPVQASLGVFALLLPFDSIATVGESTTATTLTWFAGGATGLILLGMGFVQGRLELPGRAALLWSLFILWSGASVVWALDPQLVLKRLPTASGLLAFYLVTVSFRMTRKEFYTVLGMAMVGGIAGASYAALQFFHGAGVPLIRASIGQTNPNEFALSLLLPLSIAMGAFLSMRNRIVRTAILAAIGIIGFGILISMSRGSLIAVGVLITTYIRRFRMNWRMSIALLVLGLLLLAVPNLFFERIQNSVSDRGAGRFDIWQAGWEAAKHHSIIGVGLDNFPLAFDRYAKYETVSRGYRRAPHNVYLGTLTELGIVGLLFFLAAIRSQTQMIQKIKVAANQVPMVVACEGACFAILIAGLTKDILWDKALWFSWILLASAAQLQLAERWLCENIASR
jgi:O-antigen ligase